VPGLQLDSLAPALTAGDGEASDSSAGDVARAVASAAARGRAQLDAQRARFEAQKTATRRLLQHMVLPAGSKVLSAFILEASGLVANTIAIQHVLRGCHQV
jgi:hypothetical protein